MFLKRFWLISLASALLFFSGGVLLLLASHPTPHKTVLSGNTTNARTVTYVIDGDTAILSDKRHVRFLGINSSEKGESYHDEAMNQLKKLVEGKPVSLEYENEQTDRYGRTLAYVFVGDIFVNEAMVKDGMAITDFMQKNMKYEAVLTTTEDDARGNCRGMWEGLCKPEGKCLSFPAVNTSGQIRNDEWIQIHNSCSNPIPLKGYMLKDSSSSNRFTFPDVSLVSGSTITIHSGCGTNTTKDVYWACPQAAYPVWNNDHDSAFLYNTSGLLVGYYTY